MKIWIGVLSLFLFTVPKLDKVRSSYENASKSEALSLKFYELVKPVTKKNDVRLVAYKGAGIALISRFEKTVKRKGEIFREAAELIEWAVAQAPNNLEVRFVRLTVQQNAPKFLKYNKDIVGDKEFVIRQLNIDNSSRLKKYIRDYILHSDKFTEAEKNRVAKV